MLCAAAGASGSSEEDLPLSILAERHPSQPKADAEATRSPAENAPVSEIINNALATAAAPPSKAKCKTHAKNGISEAAAHSQLGDQAEAEISAAQGTPAPASQGSPEPSSAPPTAVQPRTTRSQSKRMSSDASPSISIASKQSIQNEPEGKASMTKPPSGRRKRSLTPAHPPAAATASPAPAEAAAGMGFTVKTPLVGKKRQRTPDTVIGAATKKPVASRRSSRLSATALTQTSSEDLHREEEDSDCRPLAPKAAPTTANAATADENQMGGGVQLGSAASAADNEEQQLAEAAAGMLVPESDRTALTDTTVATLTDAAPATAAGGNPTEATAEAVSQGHVDAIEAVIAKQPPSPISHSVGASAEILHQTEHPEQADQHLLDQLQNMSGAQCAAVSTTAANQEGLAPASIGRAPTDGKDTEVAGASAAHAVSEGTAAASAVSAAAAAAAATTTDASSAAQAASTGLSVSAREEAPISAAAASIGGALAAAQAANTGLGPVAKPVDTAAEQSDVTECCASADASGLQTMAPDADMSAVLGATKPLLSTDALAADVIEVSQAVPATTSATQAEEVKSAASARARPSVASSSAPTASQVQSAESATATAAQATTAPPPATAAAAASATAAMLKTASVPKLPQTSGSTRIGLPNRLSSLSKSLLGPAQQKAGSTHIRPILSKGFTPALKSDRGAKAPHSSLSEGSTGKVFCLGHLAPDMSKSDDLQATLSILQAAVYDAPPAWRRPVYHIAYLYSNTLTSKLAVSAAALLARLLFSPFNLQASLLSV